MAPEQMDDMRNEARNFIQVTLGTLATKTEVGQGVGQSQGEILQRIQALREEVSGNFARLQEEVTNEEEPEDPLERIPVKKEEEPESALEAMEAGMAAAAKARASAKKTSVKKKPAAIQKKPATRMPASVQELEKKIDMTDIF